MSLTRAHVLVTFLLYVLLSMVPYIGFVVMLLGYVLYAGWFIAATNSMKRFSITAVN